MNQSILTKLEQLSMRLEEINALLSEQSVASDQNRFCLLYTSPSPRDRTRSRMPSSA